MNNGPITSRLGRALVQALGLRVFLGTGDACAADGMVESDCPSIRSCPGVIKGSLSAKRLMVSRRGVRNSTVKQSVRSRITRCEFAEGTRLSDFGTPEELPPGAVALCEVAC